MPRLRGNTCSFSSICTNAGDKRQIPWGFLIMKIHGFLEYILFDFFFRRHFLQFKNMSRVQIFPSELNKNKSNRVDKTSKTSTAQVDFLGLANSQKSLATAKESNTIFIHNGGCCFLIWPWRQRNIFHKLY